MENKKKLVINPNVVAFWEVGDLKKWDLEGEHPREKKDEIFKKVMNGARDKYDFKGWLSEENASKFLGVETNVVVDYRFLKNCKYYFRGYVFFPGTLYKDLKGQPNQFTVRPGEKPGDYKFNSLGSSMACGFYTGIDYRF